MTKMLLYMYGRNVVGHRQLNVTVFPRILGNAEKFHKHCTKIVRTTSPF